MKGEPKHKVKLFLRIILRLNRFRGKNQLTKYPADRDKKIHPVGDMKYEILKEILLASESNQ